jgi:hypothetical protein
MRTIRQLGPLAIAVAAIGVITWMLISGHDPIGSWLLAGLLLAHGLIHLMFLIPAPSPAAAATAGGMAWPFDLGDSWLVPRTGAGTVMTAGRILVGLIVACSLLAALAIVGIVVPGTLWAPLVAASAGCSLLLLAIGYSPALLVGVAIDVALLWLVLGSAWSPTA